MMPSENTSACTIPPRWFRKNETVIGIIGNTHGVKIDARPNPNAVSRKPRAARPRALSDAEQSERPWRSRA